MVFGGGSGSTAVTVNGLNALSGFSGNSQVNVTLQYTPSPGRTVGVNGPTTISQGTYPVSNGSITVPISSMNSTYGYHLIVTPVSANGNTITVTNPGSQIGTVGTAINGVQIQATDSAAGQTLTYSATGLPTGLSISPSGLISGTPTASGSFNVLVTARDSTGASGAASFTWTVSPVSTGGAICQVTYTKNEWTGGFTASLTITNTGTSPINGWTLAFSFPGDQKVTNAWSATVSQSAAAVTAKNVDYNAAIAPSGNVVFGFQGTWIGNDSNPAHFTLNGSSCA
ncbi:MAG: hypothetical protein AUG49_04020 [Catenulispora sp. 13_1_20CM_3_70_7]|nr:MAG: hypothetical protein AUG49_04020 [Catenulispora sp. 13_1_20CM_3_70_7]